jgi:hypothetical protein
LIVIAALNIASLTITNYAYDGIVDGYSGAYGAAGGYDGVGLGVPPPAVYGPPDFGVPPPVALGPPGFGVRLRYMVVLVMDMDMECHHQLDTAHLMVIMEVQQILHHSIHSQNSLGLKMHMVLMQ